MDRIAGKRIDTEVTSVPNPNSIRYLGAVLVLSQVSRRSHGEEESHSILMKPRFL